MSVHVWRLDLKDEKRKWRFYFPLWNRWIGLKLHSFQFKVLTIKWFKSVFMWLYWYVSVLWARKQRSNLTKVRPRESMSVFVMSMQDVHVTFERIENKFCSNDTSRANCEVIVAEWRNKYVTEKFRYNCARKQWGCEKVFRPYMSGQKSSDWQLWIFGCSCAEYRLIYS